uniref:NADH dehydrogenase subunit 6 n=1 Tax=Coptosoma variegatum TaxID=2968960 RepID=UPI002237541A|nr:NADH dehydrogenase subunit 6 [Coptosoma variegatum]UYA97860.1 NADH dehydrogenase subunit 6 [Coptosoma variegatum]
MINMLMSMMLTLSIIMIMMKHPLSMGLLLITQTILVGLISGMMISSFMMSYILIVIMISGALVLFIYMASIASNEKFKISVKVPMMAGTSILFMWLDKKLFMNKSQMIEIKSFMKMFNYPLMPILIIMIMYLFFTMIVVSSNANINEGPLRMKN